MPSSSNSFASLLPRISTGAVQTLVGATNCVHEGLSATLHAGKHHSANTAFLEKWHSVLHKDKSPFDVKTHRGSHRHLIPGSW